MENEGKANRNNERRWKRNKTLVMQEYMPKYKLPMGFVESIELPLIGIFSNA